MENVHNNQHEDAACCGLPAVPALDQVEIEKQVRLLSALADTTRLGIVRMLAGLDEPVCVCDIVSQFNLGQPTISHHLKTLRDTRLVTWEKRGLWVYYSLNRETLQEAEGYLGGLLLSKTLQVTASR